MKLPTAQKQVLESASAEEALTVEQLAERTDLPVETVTGAAFALAEEGLVEVADVSETTPTLTGEARRYLDAGLPENRLYRAVASLADGEAVALGDAVEAADLEGPEVDVALANYARKGCGTVESGTVTASPAYDPDDDREARVLAAVGESASLDRRTVDADGPDEEPGPGEEPGPDEEPGPGEEPGPDEGDVYERLESRGLLEVERSSRRSVLLTDAGINAVMAGVEAVEGVDRVTPELLTSGEWRDATFSEYNVAAEAGAVHGGRVHVLRAMAERVTEVLEGMGFREMQGPHVDAEFWINDCLFMPQDHPARTHWDQFALAEPSRIRDLPEDLVERVREAHRHGVGPDGEGYHSPWTEEVARTLALRGHTTSLSMRYLSGHQVGELEPPQRYFSVEKVYRNDTLDATHLLEFFQIEGWVMAEDLSVRDLMGTFTEFYEQFGITDVEFKPHYNPYTEPSFELFGRHPGTGELIEIGNSGLFRPEVLEPLGVDSDVMAWGLALERLLMLFTGAEDIRDVHGTLVDLAFLRNAEVVY